MVKKFEALEEAQSANADDAVLAERFADLLDELIRTVTALRAAVAGFSATGDYLDKTHIKSEFLPRLSGVMTASRLSAKSPATFLLLQFFGVITLRHFPADPTIFQTDHLRANFDWGALGRVFTDPVGLLEVALRLGHGRLPGAGVRNEPRGRARGLRRAGPAAATAASRRGAARGHAWCRWPKRRRRHSCFRASIPRFDASGGRDVGLSLYPLRASAPGATDAGVGIAPYRARRRAIELRPRAAPQAGVRHEPSRSIRAWRSRSAPVSPPKLKAGLLGDGGVIDGIDGHALVRVILAATAGSA